MPIGTAICERALRFDGGHHRDHPADSPACTDDAHSGRSAAPSRWCTQYPDWLLTHPQRAEQALVIVGGHCLPAWGCPPGAHLDAQVSVLRQRRMDAGPYTFVWVDALMVKSPRRPHDKRKRARP